MFSWVSFYAGKDWVGTANNGVGLLAFSGEWTKSRWMRPEICNQQHRISCLEKRLDSTDEAEICWDLSDEAEI